VTIAVLSTPIFAAFGSTPDRLNTFVVDPPFVLLPAVLVLAAWAGHLVVSGPSSALDDISAGSSMRSLTLRGTAPLRARPPTGGRS